MASIVESSRQILNQSHYERSRSRKRQANRLRTAVHIAGVIGLIPAGSSVVGDINPGLLPQVFQSTAQPSADYATTPDYVYRAQLIDTSIQSRDADNFHINSHLNHTLAATPDSVILPAQIQFKRMPSAHMTHNLVSHIDGEQITRAPEQRYFVGDPSKYVEPGIKVPDDLTYFPNPNFDLIHPISASIQAIRAYVYGINPRLAISEYPTNFGTSVDLVRYIVDASIANPVTIKGKTGYVDPALIFAIAGHESDMGNRGEAVLTDSLGNQRPLPGQQAKRTSDGLYADFSHSKLNWAASGDEMISLIKYIIINYNATTLQQFLDVWAPPSDGNNDYAYAQDVTQKMTIMSTLSKNPNLLHFNLPKNPNSWTNISQELYKKYNIT